MTVDELKAKIMLHSLKLISDDEISDDYIYEIIKDIKSMDFSMLTLMENMINLRRNAEIFKVWKVSSTYTGALKQMNTLLREVYKAKEILLSNNTNDEGLFFGTQTNSNNNEISDDYFGFDYTGDNVTGHD